MRKLSVPIGVGALALIVGVPAVCPAHMAAAPAAMSRVTVIQVRPDMLNEWLGWRVSHEARSLNDHLHKRRFHI